ncbi:MAG: hypothetical protein HBSAPP03_16290 [Phycisphaerae bacterium]|nr:MAG: hypothetical protein HBSAPP03_16290 [Phycisphaerae bacterium]
MINLPPTSARALLDLAAEVEADEAAIKRAVLDAAEAGDIGTVLAIMRRWSTLPSSEVLPKNSMRKDRPDRPNALDACGEPEVRVVPTPEAPNGPGREV